MLASKLLLDKWQKADAVVSCLDVPCEGEGKCSPVLGCDIAKQLKSAIACAAALCILSLLINTGATVHS